MLPSWYSLLFPATDRSISTNSIPAGNKVHAIKLCSCVESQDLFCARNVIKIIGKNLLRGKSHEQKLPFNQSAFPQVGSFNCGSVPFQDHSGNGEVSLESEQVVYQVGYPFPGSGEVSLES